MNTLSEKEWALVHKHPIYKKIPKDSPVFNNTNFCYSTSSTEHRKSMFDLDNKTEVNESAEASKEVKTRQDDFSENSVTTSEMPVKTSGEQQLAVTPDLPVSINILDGQVGDEKDTFTFFELLQMPETEIPFLVENLIPADAISILAGDSDTGKTSLYQQLALAIVQGCKEFLGLKLMPKFKRVLIVNTEDSPIAIKVRLLKQLDKTKLSDDEAKRLTIMTLTQEVVPKIEAKLKAEPVDLVAIDAFSDVYEGDTRSDNAARAFLNQFIDIIRKYKCTILFVHHIGKGKEFLGPDKGSMLGSVAIAGKSRVVLMLMNTANPLIKVLKIVKGNYVSEEVKEHKIILEFNPDTMSYRLVTDTSLKEEIKAQIQKPAPRQPRKNSLLALKLKAWAMYDQGSTLENIGASVGRDKSTISRWLKEERSKEYNLSQALK